MKNVKNHYAFLFQKAQFMFFFKEISLFHESDEDSIVSGDTNLNYSEAAGSSRGNMSILERSQHKMYETFVQKLNREYQEENQETADDVATLLDGIIESR